MLDLSPLILSKVFDTEGRCLRFRTPLKIVPRFDNSTQMLCLEYPPFHIDHAAPTREQLEMDLFEVILFLWRNYAMAPNVALTECAQRLKQALLYAIEDGTIDTTEQQWDAEEKRNGTHYRT